MLPLHVSSSLYTCHFCTALKKLTLFVRDSLFVLVPTFVIISLPVMGIAAKKQY